MSISKNEEMSYKIELEVNNHNNGYIKAEIFHCDFDFNSIMDSFILAVNAIKDWHLNNSNDFLPLDDEKSFLVNVSPKTSSITVNILDSDFDFNSLLNQIAFAVGYLQGYLYSVESSNEGGE